MMAVEAGVRGVEWPLRAERERTDSVTDGRNIRMRAEKGVNYFNCHRINLNYVDFCDLNGKLYLLLWNVRTVAIFIDLSLKVVNQYERAIDYFIRCFETRTLQIYSIHSLISFESLIK